MFLTFYQNLKIQLNYEIFVILVPAILFKKTEF